MLYIDTDGFICNIKTEDIYNDMSQMDIFDMSCYNPNFKFYKEGNYEIGIIER